MNIFDLIVGKPLKTSDERAEQIGIQEGIPIFGLDALSSAAYGPEAALSFLIPLAGGMVRVALSGGHPVAVTPTPPPPPMTEAVSGWILLKVFASGCTALTGVEAVSNGVKAFREPAVKNAQRTLTVIIFLLGLLLAGISYLVTVYGIAANAPGRPGYQSLLSMLIAAVFGKGVF